MVDEYRQIHTHKKDIKLLMRHKEMLQRIDDIHRIISNNYISSQLIIRNTELVVSSETFITGSTFMKDIVKSEPQMFMLNTWKGKSFEINIHRCDSVIEKHLLPIRKLSEHQMNRHFQVSAFMGGDYGHPVLVAPVYPTICRYIHVPITYDLTLVFAISTEKDLNDIPVKKKNQRIKNIALAIGVEPDDSGQKLRNILIFRNFSRYPNMFNESEIFCVASNQFMDTISSIVIGCGSFKQLLYDKSREQNHRTNPKITSYIHFYEIPSVFLLSICTV